jgi:hypothetical protein
MNSFYQRRRNIGRASSPPTWACYERITYSDSFHSDNSESESDDEGDYSESVDGGRGEDIDMDVDSDSKEAEERKDVKGKGKAADPSASTSSSSSTASSPKQPGRGRERARKHHSTPMYTLQPILTIQSSQGFVWNQVSLMSYTVSASGRTNDVYRIYSFLHMSKTDVCFFPFCSVYAD